MSYHTAILDRLGTVSNTKLYLEEQDKSSYIEQQPPFGDRKYSN